mmetsp:Transcript_25027/g.4144  ORF Transcript_25027/g.4144 Transcript_25027/m.4144 type:complete len:137 (+) Transcript_25027:88-498(+)
MIASLCTKNWFTFKDTHFSLRELDLGNDNWVNFDSFKAMCTEENLHEYRDLRDDCNELSHFVLGGILFISFSMLGILISLYNSISAASYGWELNLRPFEFIFPHMFAPLTYSMANFLFLLAIGISFNANFHADAGV